MQILVLGLGQTLRGDDAAGLEAVRLWRVKFPQTAQKVRSELSELPGLSLLDLLEGMEAAVIVDAVRAPTTPGKVLRIGPQELAAFTRDSRSAHGWGVAETLHLGRSLYPALTACRVTLLGIVGSQFEMGAGLSPEVRIAREVAGLMIEQEIMALNDTDIMK